MKKSLLVLIMLLLFFVSGCSSKTDFSHLIYNPDYYEKNINLNGEEVIFENGNFFISDSNNQKIRLVNC